MSVEQMRAEIMKLYPGSGWRSRVLKMSDAQVVAIYNKQIKGKR